MRLPVYSRQFRRDIRRMQKRGKDMEKLITVIDLLLAAKPLPAKFKDHALTGEWNDYRDCHVEPDWVLIYKVERNEVFLMRTGTHSDLFR